MFERDQDKFNLLFEAVSEGVIVVDHNQNIVATNSSANSMFGYDNDELLTKPLNILIPSDYHSTHKKHFKEFMTHNNKRKMGDELDIYGKKKNII